MRKKYLYFSIPLIASALLSQSYSFINSVMVGKFLGSQAFASVAVTASFVQMIESAFWGYLAGVCVYISLLFGKNEMQKLARVVKANFIFTSVLAVLIGLLCNIFHKEIFTALNVGKDVWIEAKKYFCTYIAGLVFYQLNLGFTYLSNAFGITKIPLITSIITGVINVFLNYIFISVLGKGIEYSAISTAIATFITCIFYFVTTTKLFSKLGIKKSGFIVNFAEIKASFTYGVPTMLQQLAMYGCTAFISPLVNSCETYAISGFAIADKAKSLITAVYHNSSKANTTLVAQAMGAKRIDKIKEGIKIGIVQSLSYFAGAMLLFAIFAKGFTHLFLDPAKDAQSIIVSINLIRFTLPLLLFNVFDNIFHGIFRAVGAGKTMIVSTLVYAAAVVLFAETFTGFIPYDFRIYWINIAIGAAYITECIFALVIYKSGIWKSKEYRELERAL